MNYPWSPTMPYWWHTVTPADGSSEQPGTAAQRDESSANSALPSSATGGILGQLARPIDQSWPEPKSMAAFPTPGVDWLGLA